MSNLITITKRKKHKKGKCVDSKPAKATMTYMNVGSLKNKAASICDYVKHSGTDIMTMTETWLYRDDEENAFYLNKLIPLGYKFIHNPRCDGRIGGGVGILFRKSYKFTKLKENKTFTSSVQFEHMECVVSLNQDQRSSIRLAVVYRPPPTSVNQLKLKEFWKDWKKFLRLYASNHKEFLIVGDLNFHLDEPSVSTTKKFYAILDELNLVQLVSKPTHTAGHILDIVIAKSENSFMLDSELVLHDPGLSDELGNVILNYHFAIDIKLKYSKPKACRKEIQYRKFSDISPECFLNEVTTYDLESKLLACSDTEGMAYLLDEFLGSLLNKHAPMKIRTITERPNTDWYTPAIAAEKKKKTSARETILSLWTFCGSHTVSQTMCCLQ